MAQLTDDCFAFSGPLLRLDDMERLIGERITPIVETERVSLHGARGRVVANDIKAPVDLPPFDNSAVDGFAVRHADLDPDGDTTLTISGRLPAGARVQLALKRGQAIRIFTGAAMPNGADTVFMQEDVTIKGEQVVVPKGLKIGANRRLAGEDVAWGAVVFPAGTVLDAQHIALAAGLGLTEIAVRRRLKVAIFSTGDEVVEPGAIRGGTAIYDSNRFLLTELLERLGATVTDLGILADDPEKLSLKLREAAAGHDLIVTSGGVSTGEADYMRSAVERIGKLVFWRVAIKPGRPVALGVIRTERGACRIAGKSGRGLRHICARSEAVIAPTFRCPAGSGLGAAGARGFPLQEKEGPSRICAGGTQACRRRRNRGGQAPAGWCGYSDVVDRNGWAARIPGGRDNYRARSSRGLPLLRSTHRLKAYAPRRTPLVVKALSTGSWMLLSTTPPAAAIRMAAMQATMNVFIELAPPPTS